MKSIRTNGKRVAGVLATVALAVTLSAAPASASNGNGNGGPTAQRTDTGWGP